MKSDNNIFKLTFVGFGIFVLFLCFGAYLESYFEAPAKNFTYTMFDSCVTVLGVTAELFNTDYRTINVVIFCVLMPLAFIALIVYNLILRSRLHSLTPDVFESNGYTLHSGSNSLIKDIREE